MTERLVVIGGDAAGLSAASQARRRRGPDDLAIVVFERGGWISYSACGEPYHISGEVPEITDLLARSPERFAADHIDVRRHHEVTAIDTTARTVTVRGPGGDDVEEPWDQLLIATGASPIVPPIPGIDVDGVHTLRTLDDAIAIEAAASEVRRAVVIGAGYIGLEVTEALVARGLEVTVVDLLETVLGRLLAPDLAVLVEAELRRNGVEVLVDTRIEEVTSTHGRVTGVRYDGGHLPADLVVVGGGVAPNVGLAHAAGIPVGPSGAIAVDDRQRTTVPGVWAAGDCAESRHRVTGLPVNVPLGTVANKQGRVAGINLGGGDARFPGVLGTAITRVFDLEVAGTGLDRRDAEAAGIDAVEGRVNSTTTAGYMPDAAPMVVTVTATPDGVIVGGRIVGGRGSGKRIDVIATAIWAGMHGDDLAMADLSYAPPFSGVWDPVMIAARRAADASE
jgi:NADPH-dependent 2,4-dienoyl-CoA reductase/sulfur reductase-like enzyme